jgi:hypothetical protein
MVLSAAACLLVVACLGEWLAYLSLNCPELSQNSLALEPRQLYRFAKFQKILNVSAIRHVWAKQNFELNL